MRQAPKALTVNSLERLETKPAPASRQEIPDGLLTGLYLVRQPSKAMSWVVRYRHLGEPRKLTLGPYPAIGLKAARDLGSKALRAAAEGRDPAREKQHAKVEARRQAADVVRGQRDLYENVAREFITRHAMQNTRESSWRETARILGFTFQPNDDGGELVEVPADGETVRDVLDAFKGRRVQEIAKRDVIALLDGITDRGAKTMSNRTLAVIRKLFNWAVSRDILTISPCTGVEAPASESSRDRVLDDDELRLVWNAADAIGWPYRPIIKLMALTGQREGEVAGMRWDELDLKEKLWMLPANRTKNKEQHTVALCDAAIEIIKALPHIKSSGHLVFPSRHDRPVSSFARAKEAIDAGISKANEGKPLADWVLHDLRRTVASGMARLGIQLPVIEKVLNHKSGTFRGIVGVYQRHSFADEKRIALAAWASHVNSVVSGKQPTNVIPMHSSKGA
jgi:integrase